MTKTKRVPKWVGFTPAHKTDESRTHLNGRQIGKNADVIFYELCMGDPCAGIADQHVGMTREEFIQLKAALAKMRGYSAVPSSRKPALAARHR